jgi:hypothetical protein
MKATLSLICLSLFFVAARSASAGPSLPVGKPPVQPNNMTGPAIDPTALQGQWFQYTNDLREVVCTNEFYDNAISAGGGAASTFAISGVVDTVSYDLGGNITNFTILATIFNDTGPTVEEWADCRRVG